MQAERYLVIWAPLGDSRLHILSSFGFEEGSQLDEMPLSLEILRSTLENGKAQWSGEPEEEEVSNSYLIAGIQAYLCVPWRLAGGTALLYADDRRSSNALSYTDLLSTQNLTRRPEPPVGPQAVLLALPRPLEELDAGLSLAPLMHRFQVRVRARQHVLVLGPDHHGQFVSSAPLSEEGQRVLDWVCQHRKAYLSEFQEMQIGEEQILCVPLLENQNKLVGVLYAEGPELDSSDLKAVLALGQVQTRRLGSTVALEAPQVSPRQPSGQLNLAQQILCFRTLATFVKAGIPLLQGIDCLARQLEGQAAQSLAVELHQRLLKGESLSSAFEKLKATSPFVLQLLGCAETSGQLNLVLQEIVQHLEESRSRRAGLHSALAYPAVVLSVALISALALPALVLRDVIGTYEGTKLPWPTRCIQSLGLLAGQPVFWLLLVLLGMGLTFELSRGRLALRARMQKLVGRLPVLAHLQSTWLEVNLASTLGLQLNVGVPLLTAVGQSLDACDWPSWEGLRAEVLEDLRQGMTLADALRRLPELRPSFSNLLSAGEESGRTVSVLQWVARVSKLDFEESLSASVRALEPIILLVLGALVAFVTLASMLPALSLLDHL